MKPNTLELRPLRPEDEASFRAAVYAFENEVPHFRFAFDFDDSNPFPEYVRKTEGWPYSTEISDKWVPNSFFVGVVDGKVVGRLSLRHCLNDSLEQVGGHIGYGVVPDCRRMGYATEMLKQSLPIAASLGIRKVLVTCDTNNAGSRATIERCGGVFENITNDPTLEIQKRRYWIDTEQNPETERSTE